MNIYYAIDVAYIRPSRTIETILLDNGMRKAIVYVYNRDGLYYYFFNSILELIKYFDDAIECEIVLKMRKGWGNF
ncbi:hypothetical protein [Cytophaga aurantiaca]|uniref:hypothetical protein n=1 Tax=Cytophaga aurantiaca TaxID=29530 RepID=UPI00037FF826|nr:hypothetical protein [Cytophaga aurantiaca]